MSQERKDSKKWAWLAASIFVFCSVCSGIWFHTTAILYEVGAIAELTLCCQRVHDFQNRANEFPPVREWHKVIFHASDADSWSDSLPMAALASTDGAWLCEQRKSNKVPLFVIPENVPATRHQLRVIHVDQSGQAWWDFGTAKRTAANLTNSYYVDCTGLKGRLPDNVVECEKVLSLKNE